LEVEGRVSLTPHENIIFLFENNGLNYKERRWRVQVWLGILPWLWDWKILWWEVV